MILRELITAIEAMDMDGVTAEASLGEDLAMDSQELICAAVDLSELFSVPIEDDEIRRDMRVIDVAALISQKLAGPLPQGLFEDSLLENIIINAPGPIVYEALRDVNTWPEKLPHVSAIESEYDDGRFQKFLMAVDGADGQEINVTSVRRCEENRISFFQPTPPKFLKHHCGDWLVQPLTEDTSCVTTRHQWKLSDGAAAYFQHSSEADPAESVRTLLVEHAMFALNSWKSHLENGLVQ